MRAPPRIVAWLVGLGLWLVALPAAAWVEARLVSDDVRVAIDRSGSAVVEHRITMRVAGGPLQGFDLPGLDKDVVPLEDSAVQPSPRDPGVMTPMPLELVARPDGGLRVNIASARGVSRGVFVFRVRYRRNLLALGEIQRDGAMLRARFTSPSWSEGRDNARCTFVLPLGPTEPRAPSLVAKDNDGDHAEGSETGVFVSQVTRFTDRDEVELVRPHVARNEAVTWSARVDPRALGDIVDPRLKPPPAPSPAIAPASPERRVSYLAGAFAVLFGFSALVGCKAHQVTCHARGLATPRPSIPIGSGLRVLLAGPLLTGGIALQLGAADPLWGTLVVFFAMSLTWYRRPVWHRRPRGPGRWLPLADSEAFAHPGPVRRNSWLDASTPSGRFAFVLSLAVVGIFTYVTSRVSVYHAYLVAFDGAVLFPLFGTGRVRDLPPHALAGPGRVLGRVARELRRRPGIRTIAVGRLPEGCDQFDELRLLCAPRVPLRGFAGLEVGVVVASGAGGVIYLPELLVRVIDASPSYDAFLRLLPGSRWLRGRRPDERVAMLQPRIPTLAMTIALAARLIEHATETAPPRAARPKPAQEAGRSSVAKGAKAGKARTKSSGSPDRTSKAGTVASPRHPIEQA